MSDLDLQSYSDSDLSALAKQAQGELRRRAILRALEEECYCDRYTCGRCQRLDELHIPSFYELLRV